MRIWRIFAAFLAVAATSVLMPARSSGAPPTAGTFEVHMIDVGSGLAVFVEGHDFTLLYDAGSSDDVATGERNRVVSYIRAIRPDLQMIDHLILSHAHNDHINLMPDVFARYRIRNVWNSGVFSPSCGYRAFLQSIADRPDVIYHDALGGMDTYEAAFPSGNCRGARPNETIRVRRDAPISNAPIALGNGARMTILRANASANTRNLNDASLVVRLELGARSVLLPGDSEAGRRALPTVPPAPNSAEAELLACCAQRLRSDILVASFHGSRSSSSTKFLDAVGASHYLISAGPRLFAVVRHPDLDVVAEFERRGRVWRTDVYDVGCAVDPAKIGTDNDGRPGGCSNVRIVIGEGGSITGDYHQRPD